MGAAAAISGGCREEECKKAMWWNSGGSWKERDGINWTGRGRLAVRQVSLAQPWHPWDRWKDARELSGENGIETLPVIERQQLRLNRGKYLATG
jgi:hypothetical protein